MSMHSPEKNSPLALHLAVLLFGLAGVIGKSLALPALVIVFFRTSIAAIALGAIRAIRRDERAMSLKELVPLALLGFLLAVHWIMFFYAIQISSVAIGLISVSSFPIFVTFLEPLFFREKLARHSIVAAIAVCVGLIVIAPSFDLGNQKTLGLMWGTLAALAFALISIINRKQARALPPSLTALWQNVFATCVLLPFVLTNPSFTLELMDVVLLLVLGVFCTAVAHSLFIYSLQALRAQFASVVTALEPIYGILFGWLLLNEHPSKQTLLGGTIIIGAVIFETLFHQRQKGLILEKD